MIKKKQVEPIKEVKEIADLIHSEEGPLVVLFYNDSLTLAERLYDAGYRKASDVAREIFEEIEDVLNNIGYFDEIDFNALKKKYESEKDDGN